MFSEENIEIPDEYEVSTEMGPGEKSSKKLTMGLKSYSDIKSAYRKYQKQNFPPTSEYTFAPKTNTKGKKRPFEKFIQTQ